jgi:multidrug resistance efflux pump
MKKVIVIVIVLALVGAGAYLASTGKLTELAKNAVPATPTATLLPVVEASNEIIAEGELVPVQFVNLAFKTGGVVTGVLVAEGDTVEEGQVLARLQDQEQMEAAVAAAEMELVNANQALTKLSENLELMAAAAQQEMATAEKAIDQAQKRIKSLNSGAKQTDIDTARASVVLAKDALDKANEDYEPYANKPEDNLARAVFLARLSAVQQAYDDAVRRLNNLLGQANAMDLAKAEADLAVAQASYADARLRYDKYQQGPDQDDVVAAQARIANAEAQLKAARAASADLELKAPFAGTVVTLSLKQGEFISPGTPVLLLADFTSWQVETTDLTELSVVDIRVGDPVKVSFDALPDEEFTGVVHRIKMLGENRQGDITYTVIVRPEPANGWEAWREWLRWKMTASVTVEPGP